MPYVMDSDGTTREGRTMSPAELPIVEVDQRDLGFIRVDHQVRFQFGATEVVIESPFTLVANGTAHELDPERRADLGPVLGLYPDELRALAVGHDGALRMDLESGASVTVPPDPRYEAWQVNGPGTRLVVCRPGGSSLSVWA